MKSLFKYTEERSKVVNIIICILSFVCLLLVPGLVALLLDKIIKNEMIVTLISNIILCAILYLLYFKDLNKEFNIYKGDFKNNFKKGFKIYVLGFMAMIFFNLLIVSFLKNISSNEEQVREMLYSNVFITMLCISITAPLSEEIIFRKSLQPIIKNKVVYALCCGLLFGFAHILTNILGGSFALTDLFYILPYGSLGFAFAIMDYETKTTFTSMIMHSIHNTATGILLLITYFGGFIK